MKQKEVERRRRGIYTVERKGVGLISRSGGIRHSQDSGEEAELVMCDGEMKIHP